MPTLCIWDLQPVCIGLRVITFGIGCGERGINGYKISTQILYATGVVHMAKFERNGFKGQYWKNTQTWILPGQRSGWQHYKGSVSVTVPWYVLWMGFDICVDATWALDNNVPDNMSEFWTLILDCACVSDIAWWPIRDQGFFGWSWKFQTLRIPRRRRGVTCWS